MENLLNTLEKKCLDLMNSSRFTNHRLHEILWDIEFHEGGTIHLEGETFVLSGDNGRHEFGNFEIENNFQSPLLTLLD